VDSEPADAVSKDNCDMEFVEKYLPDCSFTETHGRDLHARPDEALKAALACRAESDAFFRVAIGLREMPMRLLAKLGFRHEPAPFGFENFTLLETRPGRELVFGLIGRFWESDYGLVPIPDGAAFMAFAAGGVARLVLGFQATAQSNGTTHLVTDTRVFCPDQETLRRFAPYWYLIRPVSGLIRSRMLKSIARACATARPQYAAQVMSV